MASLPVSFSDLEGHSGCLKHFLVYSNHFLGLDITVIECDLKQFFSLVTMVTVMGHVQLRFVCKHILASTSHILRGNKF